MKKALYLFVLVWFTRLFLFDIILVKNGSMANAILNGDLFLISKLHVGPRLPITPLSVPFSDWFREGGIYSSSITIAPTRFPSLDSISVGKILVFNKPDKSHTPIDKKPITTSRLVALPRDIIALKNGSLTVNEKAVDENKYTIYPYQVFTNSSFKTEFFKTLEIDEFKAMPKPNQFLVWCTSQQAAQLRQVKSVQKLKRNPSSDISSEYLFFNSKSGSNSISTFQLPYRGFSIELNNANIKIYKELIELHEEVSINEINAEILINGQAQTSFTFTQNYYYFLSDNRSNSIDSRHFGPVPESHLIGKPYFILYSQNPQRSGWLESIRPARWFTFVNS